MSKATAGRKRRRALTMGALFAAAAFAVTLILYSLNDNIIFFFSPGEIAERTLAPGQKIRLGGLVKEDSLKREGQKIFFTVTDGKKELNVIFEGPLPDLFREGQGIVAEGKLRGDSFIADTVLAKHDETYMPREVADALKKQGHWRNGARPKALEQ